jgi:hypothetical protein
MRIVSPSLHLLWLVFLAVVQATFSISNSSSTYKLALLKDYGQKSLEKIRYLHFPRSGFPFAVAVVRYACGERLTDVLKQKDQNWKNNPDCREKIIRYKDLYRPVPLEYEDSKFTVAMFRRPVERLASQLRWMRSMVRFITTYGVHESDVASVLTLLNAVPSKSSMNSSNPCYYASANKDGLRACRYKLSVLPTHLCIFTSPIIPLTDIF